MRLITDWFKRTFSDPQVVVLTVVLVTGFAVVLFMGDMLAPALASLVIAYLLEGIVGFLEHRRVPRLAAVLVVFIAFMLALVLVIFGLLPLLSRQVSQLVQQLPSMIGQGQQLLMQLPERYPELITVEQVQDTIGMLRRELASMVSSAFIALPGSDIRLSAGTRTSWKDTIAVDWLLSPIFSMLLVS